MKKVEKLKEVNYFGFDHIEAVKSFEGDLTYLGYISGPNKRVYAAYFAANPNVEKGHKEIMLLTVKGSDYPNENNKGIIYVSGMDLKEFKKWSKHQAIKCPKCKEILYSLNRHHYHTCSCGGVSVDGGKDYFRCGFKKTKTLGVYDVLTGKFIDDK